MDKKELDMFYKGLFGGMILLAVLYFFPWKDITWGKVLLSNEGLITVLGYAESSEKNQIADFSAEVMSINNSKELAVNETNKKMAEIMKVVKGLGIEPADIKTQQINTYQNQENVPQNMMGRIQLGQWIARNSIEITLRDAEKAGALADALNASGATNVYGPNFRLDTSKQVEDKLVEAAVADARLKADKMARAGGARLGRIISIVEGSQSSDVYPLMMRAEAVKMDSSVPAPVEVGSTKISKTVTVVWSLK